MELRVCMWYGRYRSRDNFNLKLDCVALAVNLSDLFKLECSPTAGNNFQRAAVATGSIEQNYPSMMLTGCLVRRYIGEGIRLRKVLGFGWKCFTSLGFFPPAAGLRTPARP